VGSTITNDIALSLKIPLAEAERIKLEKGCAFPDSVAEDDTFDVQSLSHVESPNVPRRFLAEIIEARVLDIFDWMKKSIAQARSKGGHVASVTFTGGTAQMPGLAELGEKYLGLPVRLGVPQQINGLNEVFLTPSFATVTGLLLYGINQCERGGGVPPPNGLWDKIRDFFEKVL
jgi:cell division protein FtsA